MTDSIVKTGKKVVAGAEEAIKTAKAAYPMTSAVMEKVEPAPVKEGFQALKGVKAGIEKGAESAASAIEPNYVKPQLTDFDMARAIGAGSVRTAGQFLAGAVPTDPFQLAMYPLVDGVLKAAGTTFLGKWDMLGAWKPKTGLSEGATAIGDQFEKIITQRRIENNSRLSTAGPPKPLEILANKESEVKAQGELSEYEDWLQRLDKLSPQGGEPKGDLYPEAKVNVTQLRDAARERLQKAPE